MVEILSWSEAEVAYRRERLVEDLRAVRANAGRRRATAHGTGGGSRLRRLAAAPSGWRLRGSGAWSAAR
jgi:hypothetical protein